MRSLKTYRNASRCCEHKFSALSRRRTSSGFSLIIALVIAAGASVLVGGVLYYTSTQTTLTRRINQYDTSVSAAVAATEKVVANITKDFQTGGVTVVGNNVSTYTGLVPKTEDLTGTLLGVVKIGNSGPGNNNTVTSTTVDWPLASSIGPTSKRSPTGPSAT